MPSQVLEISIRNPAHVLNAKVFRFRLWVSCVANALVVGNETLDELHVEEFRLVQCLHEQLDHKAAGRHRDRATFDTFACSSRSDAFRVLRTVEHITVRIELDRLLIEPRRRPGLEYKYHHAGGPSDNFCFEGGVNCAIVIFDDDPINPGPETVGYVVAP